MNENNITAEEFNKMMDHEAQGYVVVNSAQSIEDLCYMLTHLEYIPGEKEPYTVEQQVEFINNFVHKKPRALITDISEAYGLREKVLELVSEGKILAQQAQD